jgi:hypothetical protein
MRFASVFRAALVAAGLAAASQAQAAMTYPTSPTYPASVNSMYDRPVVAAIPKETVSYYGPYAPGTLVVSTK